VTAVNMFKKDTTVKEDTNSGPGNGQEVLLEVNDLRTYFYTRKLVKAVDGVSFILKKGSTIGIIGESGSGKSVTSLSIMRSVVPPGKVVSGQIFFRGQDLLTVSEKEMRGIRGNRIAMVFQDPTTSLNPLFRIGPQMMETLQVHKGMAAKAARDRTLEVLGLVGLVDSENLLRKYPVEVSGGVMQRLMIALATICQPDLIIADEPTTSLGVKAQAQVLQNLQEIQKNLHTSMIFITHDIAVVSQIAKDTMVMYGGKAMEFTSTTELVLYPRHPYTLGLLKSVPDMDRTKHGKLDSIPGFPPDMTNPQPGCPFEPRCDYRQALCSRDVPDLVEVSPNHLCRCHYPREANQSTLERGLI
jgi:oligopeptide transport system ATP-binding protein